MTKEYYHDIDLKANQLFNSRLHNISTAARIILGGTLSTSDRGYMVYDTDLSSPFFWDGLQWNAAGGGSGGGTWGTITGIVTDQTDLITYLGLNYYPLSTNPANYLTSFTEVDPVFNTWLTTTPPLYSFTETDPVWTADKPSYLTSAAAALAYETIITAGTSGQYWRGDKTWQNFPSIPTVSPSALTKTDDTNVTLTLGGSPSTALLQATSLTLGWTGTLADGRIASATTWNAKEPAISTGTTGQYWRGDKTWQTFPTIPTVGTWGALNYPSWTTGTPFVKMTAAGTFSLDTTIYQTALTNPVTGTGTTNYVSKWSSSSALTDSSIQDSTIGIVATNSITAASAVAKSVNLTSTLIASANSDLLSALDITTTFTGGSFTGLTKRLFRATADSVLRTELRDSGIQQWYLNSGLAEVGQIGYGTPGGFPGIVMFNASLLGRSDIRHRANGGFTIATHALGTIPTDQFYFNTSGNFGIGTATDTYKLDVTGTGRFTSTLYADTDLIVNNYVAIDTTSTTNPNTMGIWRRKGNGYGTFFQEDEQGGPLHKWAFVQRTGYNGTRQWYSTGSSIVNINYGWQTPNASNYQGATLLIDPTINITNALLTGTVVRGIYYNPTLTSLTNTKHIGFENTTGDNYLNSTSGSTLIGYASGTATTFKLDVNGAYQQKYYTDTSNASFRMGSGYELYGDLHSAGGYQYYLTNNFGWGSAWVLNIGTNTNKILSIASSSITANQPFTFNSGWTSGQVSTYQSSPYTGVAYADGTAWNYVIRGTTGGNYFILDNTGALTLSNLSGTGTRMVVASSTGVLSTQTIPSGSSGTVTSVDLSMPTAFTVSNNPVTTSGTLTVTGAGTSAQYVKGDGSLGTTITKTSELTNDGDNGYTHFISLEDLPSNLTLYATNVASGISTYTKAVSSLTDPDFNTVAVNIPVGPLTSTTVATYCGGIVSSANIINGNPGIFTMSTIGSIRRTIGTAEGVFYYEIYKRDSGGIETLITTSANTFPVSSAVYVEFNAAALFNNGVFTATDRIVIKFYGLRLTGGSDPSFQFQFGGIAPVRTTLPIPLAVTPVPREIQSISTATAAGSIYGIDYIYLVSGTTTLTLPTAVGSVSKYTIKNTGTAVVSIATTSSQTIDGSASPITINVQNVSLDLISNGTNWNII